MNKPKLSLNLIPQSSWYKSVRSKITKDRWDNIRKLVYKKANYTCQVCSATEQTYTGSKRGWLHCDELWEFRNYKQILVGLKAVCRMCHLTKHYGFATTIGKDKEAKNHLMKINKWTEEEASNHIEEKLLEWKMRNETEWIIDYTYIDYVDC